MRSLLRFFKVLADESRLKMLGILANRECSVEELAVLLQLKEPTVSHHLNKLKELQLVKMRAEGNTHLYQLDTEALQGISKEIFSPKQIASLAENIEGEAWERKVLQNFLVDGRLKEIPASRRKRVVILKWLVNQFETGVKYPEIKVNTILKRYHEDCATLRRELIGYQFMQRENSIYWRIPNEERGARGEE
ncbi:transcriptional regulator, ArsR family [Gloeocapsa sp. PCC 7428]|nr:transcriptional regulator, ArsR family [Gloeocapsa sp. PCC 7428]